MKKTIPAIVFILCVIVIILIALPKYFSSQQNKYVEGFLTGLAKGSGNQISGKIINQSPGWFSSKSSLEIDYHLLNNSFIPKKALSGKFDLELTTNYGPVMFTKDGIKFGQAYLSYTLQNNTESAKYFKQPLMQGNTLISFTGKNKLKLSGLNLINQPEGEFAGLQTNLSFNGNLTKLKGTIQFGRLQINKKGNANEKLVISPFTQTFKLSRLTPNGLWVGTKNLMLPKITLQEGKIQSQFNNVNIKSQASIKNQKLNGNVFINSPSFSLENKPGNFNITLTMNNINTNTLAKLNDYMTQLRHEALSPKLDQENFSNLMQLAVDSLSGKSAMQIKGELNYNNLWKVTLNSGFDNSQPLSRLNFNLDVLRQQHKFAGLNFFISGLDKSALGNLLRISTQINPKGTSTPDSFLKNPQVMKLKFLANVPNVFTPKSKLQLTIYLPATQTTSFDLLNASAYFSHLKQNPNIADLVTQARLDVNWKVPTYSIPMIDEFAGFVVKKVQGVDTQIDTQNTKVVIQQLLPWMIQQGYLQQKGKYYVSSWNFSSHGILMNNKSIAPLIVEVNQLRMQSVNNNVKSDFIPPISFQTTAQP